MKGMNTKISHNILPKETFQELFNYRYDKGGALRKRKGYDLIDKAASDVVSYKDTVIARNVATKNRTTGMATTATNGTAQIYSPSTGEMSGDLGYSDGLDYTMLPVSRGSKFSQMDSNTTVDNYGGEGKFACVTYVDVDYLSLTDTKNFTKRASIIDRQTNAVIAGDLILGEEAINYDGNLLYTGNNGRRMQCEWVFDETAEKAKFYIWGEDEGALKGWVIDPTESPIVVRDYAGTATPAGTTILATANYPLVVGGSGAGYPTSLASFAVCSSRDSTKANLFTSWKDTSGGVDDGKHYVSYYVFDTDDHSHTEKIKTEMSGDDKLNGHLYAHRARITGANGPVGLAGKLAFAWQDEDNVKIRVCREGATAFDDPEDDASGGDIEGVDGVVIGRFLDDVAPKSAGDDIASWNDEIPDVNFIYSDNHDSITLGSGGLQDTRIVKRVFAGPIDPDDSAALLTGFVANGYKLIFAFGSNPYVLGVVDSLNTGVTNISEAPVPSIQLWEYCDGSTRGIPAYDNHMVSWMRDSLPIGNFQPFEYITDTLKAGVFSNVGWGLDAPPSYEMDRNYPYDSSTVFSEYNGAMIAIPVGTNFERHGSDGGTVQLNSTTTLFDFRNFNEEQMDVPAASTAVIDDILYVADKALYQFDGANFRFLNFYDRPMVSSILGTSAGGNLGADKSYSYKIVWEWTDAQGNLHQSEPSASTTVQTEAAGGTNKQNTRLTFTRFAFLGGFASELNGSLVNAAIYRTQGDGSLYNNIATVDVGIYTATTATYVFNDDISDAIGATGKPLYTDGGELVNKPPPASARYVTAHRNRLFVIGKDDVVYFSKLSQDGFGIGFNSALSIRTPDNISDPPTALGSMDGNLFIFTEKSIYIVSGEGPDNSGLGGFYDAKKIPSAIGAVKGSPVQVIDDGLLFVTTKGIYIIQKDLVVSFIGSPVQRDSAKTQLTGIFREWYTIRDIVVRPDEEVVLFLCAGRSFQMLVYNYVLKEWMLDNSRISKAAGPGGSFATSNNKLYISCLTDAGADPLVDRILLENPLTTRDNGNFTTSFLRTAWINLSGIQGYQRVYKAYILGESLDPSSITVYAFYDYNQDAVDIQETFTFFTTTTGGKFQSKMHMTKQKCQAISFVFTDTDFDSSVTGDSLIFSEIALEIGIKSDNYKNGLFPTELGQRTVWGTPGSLGGG